MRSVRHCITSDWQRTNTSMQPGVRNYVIWNGRNTSKHHEHMREIQEKKDLKTVEHIEAETKWLPFSSQHFQMHFLQWKCINFYSGFTEI